MKTAISLVILLALGFFTHAQNASSLEIATAYQDSINSFLKNPNSTYILPEEIDTFEKMDFFSINDNYIVTATLEEFSSHEVFKLTYSDDPDVPVFVVYGKITFELNGKKCSLNVYQNTAWLENDTLKNHLFLPFKDWTNGPQSYGGGRFIDLKIPEKGNQLSIDFNISYNPPCAYNYNMACPLIPESNYIEMEVFAGILAY